MWVPATEPESSARPLNALTPETICCFCATNFRLRTAFTLSHRFCYAEFLFIQILGIFSPSTVTHLSFYSVLFRPQQFVCFVQFLLPLTPTFISLCLDRIQDVISIFLYLLRPSFCPKMQSVLDNVPYVTEDNMYSLVFGWNILWCLLNPLDLRCYFTPLLWSLIFDWRANLICLLEGIEVPTVTMCGQSVALHLLVLFYEFGRTCVCCLCLEL